jgi:hypothetical protein
MTLETAKANPYRFRRETGGWLLARAGSPTEIVAATGPGADAEHHPDGVYFSRAEFEPAARAQGFVLAGEWHCHPDSEPTDPSPDDKRIWDRQQLETGADSYASVILARGSDGKWATGTATGYRTTRAGCEPVALLPRFSDRLLGAARHQAHQVSKGPLLRSPASWKAGELQREIAMLELDDELYERMQLRELSGRLNKLGIKADLRPIASQTIHSGRPALHRRPARNVAHDTIGQRVADLAARGIMVRGGGKILAITDEHGVRTEFA